MEVGNPGQVEQSRAVIETDTSTSLSLPLPLHRQIAAQIRQQIENQELPVHSKLASEILLARQYGVSRGTITKALDMLVQQQILYRRRPQGTFVAEPVSAIAQPADLLEVSGVSSPTLPTMGLIVPYLKDSLDGSVILGVETVARAAGYGLIFAHSENDWTLERYHVEQFLRREVAGILIFPADPAVDLQEGRLISRDNPERARLLDGLRRRNTPFVLIDRYIPGVECDYVVCADETAGYAATQHLATLGHRRIGFISIAPLVTSTAARYTGYLTYLREHHLPIDERLAVHALRQSGPPSMPGGVLVPDAGQEDRALLQTYLRQPDAPSAVIAANDYVALRLLQAAEDVGLNVPGDLALVSCGGGDVGSHARVPLTSILQPAVDLGRQATHLLLDRIAGRSSAVRQISLPVSLVVRESCGAPPRRTPLAVQRAF